MQHSEEDLKKCPYCAEWVKTEAILCRFCNQSFLADPNSARESQQMKRSFEARPVWDKSDPFAMLQGMDARELTLYESEVNRQRKTLGAVYLLLILAGSFGAHKFYLEKPIAGCSYLTLFLLGFITLSGTWWILCLCLLFDVFTSPGQVKENEDLIRLNLIHKIQFQTEPRETRRAPANQSEQIPIMDQPAKTVRLAENSEEQQVVSDPAALRAATRDSGSNAVWVIFSLLVIGGVCLFGWAAERFAARQHQPTHYQAVRQSAVAIGNGFAGWKFKTGGAVQSSPASDGKTIYFGSNDGRLYAVDMKTGSSVWVSRIGGEIQAAPAISSKSVYFGDSNGFMYCLDKSSGKEMWRFKVDGVGSGGQWMGNIYSAPALRLNVVYFGSVDHNVYALDTKTGHLLWKFHTGAEVNSSPAVFGNAVYVGSRDGNLYVLDAATGKQLWQFCTTGSLNSAASISDNRVYFTTMQYASEGATSGSCLHAVDVRNHNEIWNYSIDGRASECPLITKGVAYVGSPDSHLYAIDKISGKLKWKLNVGSPIESTPAVAKSVIYFGDSAGNVRAVNDQGGELWAFPTGNKILFCKPLIDRKMLYCGSDDGYLYAVEVRLSKTALYAGRELPSMNPDLSNELSDSVPSPTPFARPAEFAGLPTSAPSPMARQALSPMPMARPTPMAMPTAMPTPTARSSSLSPMPSMAPSPIAMAHGSGGASSFAPMARVGASAGGAGAFGPAPIASSGGSSSYSQGNPTGTTANTGSGPYMADRPSPPQQSLPATYGSSLLDRNLHLMSSRIHDDWVASSVDKTVNIEIEFFVDKAGVPKDITLTSSSKTPRQRLQNIANFEQVRDIIEGLAPYRMTGIDQRLHLKAKFRGDSVSISCYE